jgi:parallel beta-helix repeat protein
VVENNGGSGASLGPNFEDLRRRTVIQRNRIWNNGRLNGTTGGLQLNGLSDALVQDNDCRGNWTTATFDGVNLFMDIISSATSEMQTRGAVGCVVRRNYCADARGAGGLRYEDWLTEQRQEANSANAPSSGIRLYFGRGNIVFGNVVENNGSGIACDKSADNRIFNNTAVGCTMGFYDGVGLATRANRFENNVSHRCDWDFYGLRVEGWTPVSANAAEVQLSAVSGSYVAFTGDGEFSLVRPGVGGRNFFVREQADRQAERGLAVVSMKESDNVIRVHVLRPFSALRFAAGELLIGAMEPYLSIGNGRNARFAARIGSIRELLSGDTDVTADPLLTSDLSPAPGSPLIAAGRPIDVRTFVELTDRRGRPFGATPSIGAFEGGS